MNQKVAVVTGSSSGIGLETSLTLAENNFRTYATMRNLDKASNILEPAKKKNNLSIEVVKLAATATEAITTTRESDDGSITSSNSGLLFPRPFLKCLMSRIDIRIILIVQIKGNFLPIYFKPLLTIDPYTLYQNYDHQNILTRSKSLSSLYNCFIYSNASNSCY